MNVTGVFMTCQAVARVMVKYGTRGSMVVIASMSGSIANRVSDGEGVYFVVDDVITTSPLHDSCPTA